MIRPILILCVMLAGAMGAGWFAWQRVRAGRDVPSVDVVRAQGQLHKEVLPVLNQYCWDCHGDGASKGGLNLDPFTNVTAVLSDKKTWERILGNLREGTMPPMKKPQPTLEQRELVGHWIEHTLFPVNPKNPDPGRVTLRRLNRVEYNNTVRDLVGVDFKPADDFPTDDIGYGFDNIGDVLSLPPVLLEKYLRAAHRIMDEAVVTGPPDPIIRRYTPKDLQGDQGGDAVATMSSNGAMWVEALLKHAGEYRFRIRAYGDQAGEESVKMALRVDGTVVKEFEVKARKGRPEDFAAKISLEPGKRRVEVAFLNDFYAEEEKETKDGRGRPKKEKVIKDRNLQVLSVECVGPYTDVVPPLPATHVRLFATSAKAKTETERANEILGRFASRAFRRPATTGEIGRLLQFVTQAKEGGDSFEMAIKAACTAVLVSPHFLFRGEVQPEPDNPRSVHPINEHALASRLSYFLWSTMPDDELTRLADQGRLRKNLEGQVRRMLRDERSNSLIENFASQWLNLRLLDVVSPDKEKYPTFDEALRKAMGEETRRFLTYILREDRNVMELLSADYTFANERLARHYGIPGVTGEDFVKVSTKGTPRGGLLTQASILTLTSNPTRTSPVKRGKYILDNVLGTPPPPAPPNVPTLEAEGRKLTGTLRQQMEQHRENPLCSSCHARMDAIGFSFENFDAVGGWREKDGADVIDPSGVLVTGEKFSGAAELRALLLEKRRPEFLRCVAERTLVYALGRGVEYYDKPALDSITRRLEKGGFKFSELILGVVESTPFQKRRGEGDPTLAEPTKAVASN